MALGWLSEGFVYYGKRLRVQSLDPRVRFVVAAELLGLVLAAGNWQELALATMATGAVLVAGGVLRASAKALGLAALFSPLMVAINLLYATPLLEAPIPAAKFVLLVGAASIFFLSISPDEVDQVLRSLRVPRDMRFAFTAAVRFLPALILELGQVLDAQRSRGLELDKGNPFVRLKRMGSVLAPMTVVALVKSQEVAEAMEARAYGASARPSSMYSSTALSRRDMIVLVANSLTTGILLYSILYLL